MARMHSGARGKAGSKRPPKHTPSWAPYKEKEVEKLVVKYAKLGKRGSEVGMILRDSHGVNSVKALTGKSVGVIMKEHDVATELPEDMLSLIRKLIEVKAHIKKNHHDMTAGRGLILTTSKIRRLAKYYKKQGALRVDWELDQDRLKMYLE